MVDHLSENWNRSAYRSTATKDVRLEGLGQISGDQLFFVAFLHCASPASQPDGEHESSRHRQLRLEERGRAWWRVTAHRCDPGRRGGRADRAGQTACFSLGQCAEARSPSPMEVRATRTPLAAEGTPSLRAPQGITTAKRPHDVETESSVCDEMDNFG
ncbi:hypothetical protein MRX96_029300 [Rhipicephalus microplus]